MSWKGDNHCPHTLLFSLPPLSSLSLHNTHTHNTHTTHTPLVASGCLFPKQDGCCNTRRRRKKHVAKGRHGFKQKKRQKDRREHSWLCLEQQTTRAHKKVKTYAHTYTHAARTYTPHTHTHSSSNLLVEATLATAKPQSTLQRRRTNCSHGFILLFFWGGGLLVWKMRVLGMCQAEVGVDGHCPLYLLFFFFKQKKSNSLIGPPAQMWNFHHLSI